MTTLTTIAQAMYEGAGYAAWDEQRSGVHDMWLSAARAAVEAMREPSEGMVDRFVSRALCVSVHGEGGWSNYARGQWATMIDHILSE